MQSEPPHRWSQARIRRAVAVTAAAVLTATLATFTTAGVSAAALPRPATSATTSSAKPVFAYYYLWWSKAHWIDMLGPNYPTSARPLPLPATLDATGCHPVSKYAGNQLTDVPATLGGQDDPGFIEADVRQAAAAGLTGFAVNWIGNGSASQDLTSVVYNRRLRAMVDAVHKVNAEGIPFKLWLSYKASARLLSTAWILHDLQYFLRTYGNDSAFDRSASGKPTIIWQGSRKYSVSVLQSISPSVRNSARLIGDETTWSASRAPFLDGDAYYWSSQDPWGNPQSFAQLGRLASAVRSSAKNPDGSTKVWVAPVAPGYDKQLSGGSSCVPRRNGDTLRALFKGNATTNPDAWGLISWNEIAEGTYIDPMTRYGSTGLAALNAAIRGGA